MKAKLIIAVLAISFTTSAQPKEWISGVYLSAENKGVVEVSLYEQMKSLDNPNDDVRLGKSALLIKSPNQDSIKMEFYRFRCSMGKVYVEESVSFIQVFVFYDKETVDTRDDLFLGEVVISFPTKYSDTTVEELMEVVPTEELFQALGGAPAYKTSEIIRDEN